MIRGIHHIAIKCVDREQFDRTIAFYRDTLGLPECLVWDAGVMLDTGAGRLEIFPTGGDERGQGVLRHIAFDVTDTDACIEKVRAKGYSVTVEPKDVTISTLRARIAFCIGPVGEEVEFFQVKGNA